MNEPTPFEIEERDGVLAASNGAAHMACDGGRIFRRRAVKNFNEMIEWAVAELDGVRVYFDGTRVVVTRRDIYP